MARNVHHRIKMTEEDNDFMEVVCGKDEALQQAAEGLFKHHKAAGTILAYQQVQRDFKDFCDRTDGLSYLRMSKIDVGRFVLDCKIQNKGYAYWGQTQGKSRRLG